MVEIEASHLLGIVIALLTYIAGRSELFGKCLRQLRADFDIHIAIVRQKEKDNKSHAAI